MKKWYVLLFAIILAACTDYVNQIEDERDEWRTAQELAALSSSKRSVSSSSTIPTILWKSSSSEKANTTSSSANLSGDSHEESSSSTVKMNSSSSGDIASSDSSEESCSSSTKTNDSFSSSSDGILSSSNSRKDDASSSSDESSSSEEVSSSSISYGVLIDERDGQTYKTVAIGSQIWMAENLNYEMDKSYCYENSDDKCAKYGRLYKLSAAKNACPNGWRLPVDTEFESLISIAGENAAAAKNLKSSRGWGENENGINAYGFTVLPAGLIIFNGISADYGNEGRDAYFWSASEDIGEAGHYMYLYYNDVIGLNRIAADMYAFSVRCLMGTTTLPSSSESALSSSSNASWAYLNPVISYGEMTDGRDGQVYKTVVIEGLTWMAENLNYESVKSFCYENEKDSCSKYGRLYTWSAAMDSVGAFTTNSKGCGYPNECYYSKTPVQGVCPEKWHLPSQQEWYDLSTYNSSTISGDLSSAGERLKSTNGWFNSGNGDDTYGFSVLPAGIGAEDSFSKSGEKTCFWSSSDGNGIDAYGIHFEYSNSKGVLQGTIKYAGCSVRCVKD